MKKENGRQNLYLASSMGCIKLDILSNKSSSLKVVHRADFVQEKKAANQLDYGARYYDPVVGRWGQVDPMGASSKQQGLSLYQYANNNPVTLYDPDGKQFEDPKQRDYLIEKTNDRITSLREDNARLKEENEAEGTSKKQIRKNNRTIQDNDARIEELGQTLLDIDALDKDQENLYKLVGPGIGGSEKHRVYQDPETGVVKIEGANDALHIHEIRHVALSLSVDGFLDFNDKNNLKPVLSRRSGKDDEIQGYRAQYAFRPGSLPRSAANINSIDFKWVASLTTEDGSPMYKQISDEYNYWKKMNKKYNK
jgi:RHS repeat-associated protein